MSSVHRIFWRLQSVLILHSKKAVHRSCRQVHGVVLAGETLAQMPSCRQGATSCYCLGSSVWARLSGGVYAGGRVDISLLSIPQSAWQPRVTVQLFTTVQSTVTAPVKLIFTQTQSLLVLVLSYCHLQLKMVVKLFKVANGPSWLPCQSHQAFIFVSEDVEEIQNFFHPECPDQL